MADEVKTHEHGEPTGDQQHESRAKNGIHCPRVSNDRSGKRGGPRTRSRDVQVRRDKRTRLPKSILHARCGAVLPGPRRCSRTTMAAPVEWPAQAGLRFRLPQLPFDELELKEGHMRSHTELTALVNRVQDDAGRFSRARNWEF